MDFDSIHSRTIHIESMYWIDIFCTEILETLKWKTFNYCYIWMFDVETKHKRRFQNQSASIQAINSLEMNQMKLPPLESIERFNKMNSIILCQQFWSSNAIKKPFLITLLPRIIDFRMIRLRSKDSSVLEWYAFHCGCLLAPFLRDIASSLYWCFKSSL